MHNIVVGDEMIKNRNIVSKMRAKPDAVAKLYGSSKYPSLRATASFYQTADGVLVAVSAQGLPSGRHVCENPIFALHIHGGNSCSGSKADAFADAGSHYNPNDCAHPYHAGDMPPLFGADGTAFTAFLTDRFSLDEVIGKTVIIHAQPDDFATQPAGGAGEKMACGIIVRRWML